MPIPRIIISATKRSSGKTILSIGLTSALNQNGLIVQTFKKGADYIDPMWLKAASSRECYNLDFFMMGEKKILSSFQQQTIDADIAIIEGNMGLHDGIDLKGSGSTSHLAKMLKSPVILVINTTGINRGIAPLVLGYQQFDPDLPIDGIILNQVKSARHESKLINALNYYCGIDILGAIPASDQLEITERHLGLVPIQENITLSSVLKPIEKVIRDHVNLNRVVEIAKQAPPLDKTSLRINRKEPLHLITPDIKLGIAQDQAFHFYYPDNLKALKDEGAQLIPFNTLSDPKLPDVNGLYIGGGFPEVFMDGLEKNVSLRNDILSVIEKGMPVYAECGGLMYLSRSIFWNGSLREMVGGIPCDVRQCSKPKGKGYVILSPTEKSFFQFNTDIKAHEFHYSEILNIGKVKFAYRVKQGFGIDGKHDGLIYKNVFASYSHLHALAVPQWAKSFIQFVKKIDFHHNSL